MGRRQVETGAAFRTGQPPWKWQPTGVGGTRMRTVAKCNRQPVVRVNRVVVDRSVGNRGVRRHLTTPPPNGTAQHSQWGEN